MINVSYAEKLFMIHVEYGDSSWNDVILSGVLLLVLYFSQRNQLL